MAPQKNLDPTKRPDAYPDPNKMKQTGGPGVRGGKKWYGSNMPVEVRSLARSYTKQAIQCLVGIIKSEKQPGMARVAACKVLLDRGWGRATESHNLTINGETSLLKVVNEIVHVHETREQVEFRDQTPLLELKPEDSDSGSKSTH